MFGGDEVGQVTAPADRAQTGGLVAVFDRDRQAVQHAESFASGLGRVGRTRSVYGSVDIDRDDRVKSPVVAVDARQIKLEQFSARYLPCAERRQLLGRGPPRDVVR